MRRWLMAIGGILLFALPISAAGTVTLVRCVTYSEVGVTRCAYAWTSDGSGNVSGNTSTIISPGGSLIQVALIPGTSGSQPDDDYALALKNQRGVDVLAGAGGDLSNSATAEELLDIVVDKGSALQPVIANAGSSKSGQIVLWFRIRQ